MQNNEKTRKNLVWFLEQQLDIQLDMLKHQTDRNNKISNQSTLGR